MNNDWIMEIKTTQVVENGETAKQSFRISNDDKMKFEMELLNNLYTNNGSLVDAEFIKIYNTIFSKRQIISVRFFEQ